MSGWNTLFYDKENIEIAPEPEVVKFVELLRKEFPEQEKKVWDLGCGAVDKITELVNCIQDALVKNGYFLGTIKSTKADLFGLGEEIEKNTFILNEGKEEGILHHYFDEEGIKNLFPDDKWEIVILAEQVMNYVSKIEKFWEINPFRYTTWCILAKKR